MKSATVKNHRSGNRPVKSSSSVESSSSINTESSSMINTVSSSSANKPSKNTETSVEVPSKASTISYVNHSTEKSVPVTVSSETNTMVESSVSSAVRTGSGSSSFGSSMINKPTLVSSLRNVPATSWSKENVNGSSATTVGTTAITYSQSELPNKGSNRIVNEPTISSTTPQNTTVINHSMMAVENSSSQAIQSNIDTESNQLTVNAQNTQSGKNSNNSHGENLPQTGEEQYAVPFIIGIVMLTSVAGATVYNKKK